MAPFQEESVSSHRVSIHTPKKSHFFLQIQPALLFISLFFCRCFGVLEALRLHAAWEGLTVREERSAMCARLSCASKCGKVRRTPSAAPWLRSCQSTFNLWLYSAPYSICHGGGRIPPAESQFCGGDGGGIPGGGLINGFFRAARVVVLTYASHATLPISWHLGFLPSNADTYWWLLLFRSASVFSDVKEPFCLFIQHLGLRLR